MARQPPSAFSGIKLAEVHEASIVNYSYRWCDWARVKSKTQYPPGEHFNYSTMDTSVLGREFYGASMNATLRDYGRFGLMMLNGGKSGDWVKVSTAATDNVGPVTPDGRLGYGYQWWTIANSEAYAAQGLFNQYIFIDPKSKTVIVKLDAPADPPGFGPENIAFFQKVVSEISGK